MKQLRQYSNEAFGDILPFPPSKLILEESKRHYLEMVEANWDSIEEWAEEYSHKEEGYLPAITLKLLLVTHSHD